MKELDYRYVDDVRGANAAGGEVPPKPPVEVREKDMEKVLLEASATDDQEKATQEALVLLFLTSL